MRPLIGASSPITTGAIARSGAFKRSRVEQLFHDVRMGRFHPGNKMLAHELIGKLCLGLDPDASPRWG